MDALKLEIENLGEVNVVERVRFVDLVLQRLRRSRGRFVIVERNFGWRDWFERGGLWGSRLVRAVEVA